MLSIAVALLIALTFFIFGVFLGSRIKQGSYNGAVHIKETEQGLKYTLELAGDPELLVFQDSIHLKVLPPDYEKLLSQQKRGV